MYRRTIMALTLATLAAVGGGVAAANRDDDQTRLAKAMAGYTPVGAPMSCLPTLPLLHSTVYGKTIIYQRAGGRTLYRNDTAGGCESAANGDTLFTEQHEGRPCSGDILRTVDTVSRMTNGSCALGQFTRYDKVK